MPQILRVGPYSVYFWPNEGEPLEPIHVHISEGRANSARIIDEWLNRFGDIRYFC